MTAKPPGRFIGDKVSMKVNPVTHAALAEVKEGLEGARGRQVTFEETLDVLIELYNRAVAAASAKEGQ